MVVFMGVLHLVFVCILFGLARFYAALPCHAAIVMGASLLRLERCILYLAFPLIKSSFPFVAQNSGV